MIAVIGLGYVGLTTAVGFSFKGFKVYGYELDKEKLKTIKSGNLPFYEQGLDKALKRVLKNQNFIPTNDIKTVLKNSKVIMFCVGTPSNNKGVNLFFLKKAIEKFLEHIKDYKLLIIRSTIPPGTMISVIKGWIKKQGLRIGKDIGLAYNPEFLQEGNAWHDFLYPGRIILGVEDKKSWQMIKDIYRVFKTKIFKVSFSTAEFIKYLSNSLLVALISFSNEMAGLAETLGDIDISTAFKIIHQDKRWFGDPALMTKYVYPGCGFGGSCLKKDTLALIKKGRAIGFKMDLLEQALKINESRKKRVVKQIKQAIGGGIKGKKITVLGLAFKPGTNDVRETPAKTIIKGLLNQGAVVTVYDPLAMKEFKRFNLKVKYAQSMETAIKKAKLILIATAWPEFKKIPSLIEKINPNVLVIDGRWMFSENKRSTGKND